ncbi:MAG: molybdopterin dinucleotide binding domain-containing protein, partial [Pseudomonadota bacterium]
TQSSALSTQHSTPSTQHSGLQRVADVPIYYSDAVVRRSAPLQATTDGAIPLVWMHGDEMKKLGLESGTVVKVSQGQGSVRLFAAADDGLPVGVVRLAAGHAATAALGAMFGTITVERA